MKEVALSEDDDDGGGDHGGLAADHVGNRVVIRSHEPYRGTDGRRDDLVGRPD